MEQELRAAWTAFADHMEAGTVTLREASEMLGQVETAVSQLVMALELSEESVPKWSDIIDGYHRNLGKCWVIQQHYAGRRDKQSRDARRECRDLAEGNMRELEKARKRKCAGEELAVLAIQQRALLNEAVNAIYAQDWKQAARYLRQGMQVEEQVERLSEATAS